MTLSLILNNSVDIIDFVSNITFSGDSNKFNTQISLTVQASTDGRIPALYVDVGDKLSYNVDGINQFVGIVFSTDIDSSGARSITAYDTNIYLAKSSDSRIFTNIKASDIVRILANDFGVSLGQIDDTGYIIPYLKFSEKSLTEMINTALQITFNQLGVRYFVGNNVGNLTLIRASSTPTQYIFKDSSNLINASLSRSIEDLATQVKVIGGVKGKESVVVSRNDINRSRYGVLQIVESLDESATASQVKQRADTLLKESSEVSEQLTVDVLEVSEIRVGSAVYISSKNTNTSSGYFVTSFSKNYSGGTRTMSLELSKTRELPQITIDDATINPEAN